MEKFESLNKTSFSKLPLIVEGESKEVRYLGGGLVAIKLKPTIYSYTHNRAGIIDGSDNLRLKSIANLLPVIQTAGLQHTYQGVNDRFILSDLVLQPEILGETKPFRPDDLSDAQINQLPLAPPIEVIVKKRHTGTSKHRYWNFSKTPTRQNKYITEDDLYPSPVVRFDWRNPMINPSTGDRLADEVLPIQTADLFIDTKKATVTATRAFNALDKFMMSKGLELWDICFFISSDGKNLFGEISPDCMRVRACGGKALDKDVWRAGGSSELILKKWTEFVKLTKLSDKVS